MPFITVLFFLAHQGGTGVCKIIAQPATVSNGLFFSVACSKRYKKHSQCKYATLYVMKRSLDEQLFCKRQYAIFTISELSNVCMQVFVLYGGQEQLMIG